jgi:phosphatidate cytidylyltransferase
MPDRDDRDVDDLFGDLDEFFAPIEDVDWPEREEGEGEEPPTTGAEERKETPGDEEGEWAPSIDLPEEEELVGPAARGEEGEEARDAETAEPEPEQPEQPEEALEEDEPPAAAELFAELNEPPPETPEPGEPEEATAEMSGEEWDHLRSALGEEPGEPGEAEAAEEGGPADLSVDDLRRAPPQYEDLPAPEVEEDEEPFVEPVLAEEATFEAEEPPPSQAAREEPQEEEVTSEDVEAAAQHFAGGIEPDEIERELLADLEEAEEAPVVEEEPSEPEEVSVAAPVPETEPLAGEGPPTWQEPAAYEVEEEPPPAEEAGPPPPTGRNLGAAAASGVILAVAAIALLAVGKGAFVVLAVALVTLGQGEFYAVMRTRGYQPATAIGLVAGVLTMSGAYLYGDTPGQGEAAVLFGLALGTILTVPWFMAASPGARKGLVGNTAVTILGIVYGPVLVSFGLILLAAPEVGTNIFLTVVGLTVLYDICAYAIGTMWGDRPLAPSISPRKSWEGAIGAAFVLLVVSLAVVPQIEPFSAGQAVGLALLIAVVAPLGDLVESAIKRDLGVKDMGSLLPGHGGIFDRIDAILFTAPAAYIFLRLVA